MEKSAAELRAEINRLAAKLDAMDGQPAKKEASTKSASRTLLAEIDDLEEQIAGMYAKDEDEDDKTAASKKADDDTDDADADDITADDDADKDDVEEDKKADDDDADDKVDEEITSSEAAPGIEDEITQDKFGEVEDTRHGKELSSGPSMRSIAPTNYTARLKQASARLDRVADYLEKQGRKQLALRVDKIADAIDQNIQEEEEA